MNPIKSFLKATLVDGIGVATLVAVAILVGIGSAEKLRVTNLGDSAWH